MESLLQHARHQRRFAHGHRHLSDGLSNGLYIDRLEIFFMQTRARRLAGDAQNRNGVSRGGVQRGDHIRSRRARCSQAYADIAGRGPRITFRHMRRAFHVTRQNMTDPAVLAHRRIERVNRRAGHAKCGGNSFFFQYIHCRVDGSHFCHFLLPRYIGKIFQI